MVNSVNKTSQSALRVDACAFSWRIGTIDSLIVVVSLVVLGLPSLLHIVSILRGLSPQVFLCA